MVSRSEVRKGGEVMNNRSKAPRASKRISESFNQRDFALIEEALSHALETPMGERFKPLQQRVLKQRLTRAVLVERSEQVQEAAQ